MPLGDEGEGFGFDWTSLLTPQVVLGLLVVALVLVIAGIWVARRLRRRAIVRRAVQAAKAQALPPGPRRELAGLRRVVAEATEQTSAAVAAAARRAAGKPGGGHVWLEAWVLVEAERAGDDVEPVGLVGDPDHVGRLLRDGLDDHHEGLLRQPCGEEVRQLSSGCPGWRVAAQVRAVGERQAPIGGSLAGDGAAWSGVARWRGNWSAAPDDGWRWCRSDHSHQWRHQHDDGPVLEAAVNETRHDRP